MIFRMKNNPNIAIFGGQIGFNHHGFKDRFISLADNLAELIDETY